MASCVTCAMPPTSSHLSVSRQVCTPPAPVTSVTLKSFPTCYVRRNCVLGLRCGGMQGRAGESGTLCLGNTHPHARTCFHSVKCVLDHGRQASRQCWDAQISLPSSRKSVLSMESKGLQGERASPDLCRGGETCFSGVDGEWGPGGL